MKYIKILSTTFAIFSAGLMLSCQDDIVSGRVDETNYGNTENTHVYIRNVKTSKPEYIIDLRDEGSSAELYIGLTKAAEKPMEFQLSTDLSLIEEYNELHDTDFDAFPANLASLQGNGKVTVKAGSLKSEPFKVSLSKGDELELGKTYLLPVALPVNQGVKTDIASHMLLVKYLGGIPDTDKGTGISIISCIEVNDTNPLNNLEFTLESSGKPLVDIVVLFSGNINYNEQTGRVYVANNENVRAILDNRDKYIKPLQDKGMKVLLGILGNWDRAGIGNLAPHTAKAFAAELKSYCDAYGLDGVFYDDEYSDYEIENPGPAFVEPSRDAAARLVYETKMAMPDKLCTVYVLGYTGMFKNPVDGVLPGDFIDWAVLDYEIREDPTPYYLGLTRKQVGYASQEFNTERWIGVSGLKELRSEGYGGHMIFAMDPTRSNFDGYTNSGYNQLDILHYMAKYLFDDELVWSGKSHKKDW